ncbi:MAG: flagellar assembly protein H [Oscillatoriales cyanobacterium]|nr:MAG: flagellar assembly protein H [Oscillatoriales cyanobacterium]TAH25295.1 MAG: flagellar assembly protein H [Oscillatoriales cyanobacterium]
MTRFIHDRFAKEYLEEMLSPIGTVNIGRDVTSEVREIDVYFTPGTPIPEYTENLGLLGKMASTTAIFEPFRNPIAISDVWNCTSKLFDLRRELERQARRENTRYDDAKLPFLWILTPTASKSLVSGFGGIPNLSNWLEGIYFFPEHWQGAIVVIHQLPETPETLWLRILGKGKVQQRAISQLSALATDDPLRITALELLYRLQSNLVTDIPQELESEERELIMAITPLFQQQIQAAQQQAREEGLEQGRQEQQRLILSDFLSGRFGELSPKMSVFLTPLSKLSATEFTRMLLGISMLTVDESGQQQAVKLLAEYVLRRYLNESPDILATAVSNLLELSVVELTVLVEEMPQLSADELRARL